MYGCARGLSLGFFIGLMVWNKLFEQCMEKLIKLKYVKRFIEICIWILELNKCLVYQNKLINKHTLVISIKNYYYAFLYY